MTGQGRGKGHGSRRGQGGGRGPGLGIGPRNQTGPGGGPSGCESKYKLKEDKVELRRYRKW